MPGKKLKRLPRAMSNLANNSGQQLIVGNGKGSSKLHTYIYIYIGLLRDLFHYLKIHVCNAVFMIYVYLGMLVSLQRISPHQL